MIENVSDTALWVATYREDETKRPDALFRDPLAGVLVGDRGRKIARHMKSSRYTAWAVVIRTCIIDAYIKRLISEGADTVLNLGAGLDTRPYRMDLPTDFRWIEVDFPHMIQYKEERLRAETPKCKLERIKLDLSNREARAKLFSEISSRSSKVIVITEGVTPYLKNEDVAALAEDLRAQSAFKFWIVDYFSPQVLRHIRRGKIKRQMKNAPFQFSPGDWFEFFSQRGWKAAETRYLVEESEKLGRSFPLPWWARFLHVIVPRKKRNAHRKFTAYVVLEPK